MSESKRYKNKLSRFDEEHEELKKVKNEKAEKERVKKETEILKEKLKARRAAKEKEEAERAESELTENDGDIKDDNLKDGKIYSPVARDVEFLEDLIKDVKRNNKKGKKRFKKKNIILPVIAFILLAEVGICLAAGFLLPAMIIAIAGAASAVTAALVGCISISIMRRKKEQPARRCKNALKEQQTLTDSIKFRLVFHGKVTAAQITACKDLRDGMETGANAVVNCKIEYSYSDENQIARNGCYEGEIPPFFLETFKAEGILPILFIKGTSRVLTHFPRRLGEYLDM